MVALKKMGLCMGVLAVLLGCDVEDPPESSGGVTFGQRRGASCDRGVVIVASDYKSTNIAISDLDGVTLSGSFVSTGAKKPGLSLALSGDVDVPWVAPASERLVLIDRFGTNVITWLDTATAQVIAQLPVGQGFESNPHDYIEVDANRAFVSRYGTNPNPGAQAWDEGGDLLILDTQKRTLVGRIPMPEDNSELDPCPSGMTRLGNEVIVSLGRWASDFSKLGDGRFVGVSPSTDSVTWSVDVTGLQSCGRVAVSPNGARLAIACSSRFDSETKSFDPSKSDIVLYDATVSPPKELKRFGLGVAMGSGIQPAVAFASNDLLIAKAYGGAAVAGDRVFSLNIATGATVELAQAASPYAFAGLRCSPGCGDVCLLSDAEKNRLRRWKLTSDTLEPLEDMVIENQIGLPPRSLGGV